VNVYDLDAYDYDLPEERIAQTPAVPRDASRLMVWNVGAPGRCAFRHRVFGDLADCLRPGDLLVLNDTRVIPARLLGEKATGGKAEILLLGPLDPDFLRWRALARPGRRLPDGTEVRVGGRSLVIEGRGEDGVRAVRLDAADKKDALAFLERCGKTPLPPYIKTPDDESMKRSYQTVFAAKDGSAAAPTASLHFTEELLRRLEGVAEIAWTTLHVGLGTFRPVKERDIRRHRIHSERCEVPEGTAEAVRRCRERGGRVVAAGTTVARTLESFASESGLSVAAGAKETELFIYPGFRWRVTDALITNFHLPRSSLLMLVASFVSHLTGGAEEEALSAVRGAYALAVSEDYRFFSFGDAMLIENQCPQI
jgi:S-adenosylmethionine:tRNA ribosyltransferase-isomerase